MNFRTKFYRKFLTVAASAALLTSIAVPAASANMKGVKAWQAIRINSNAYK